VLVVGTNRELYIARAGVTGFSPAGGLTIASPALTVNTGTTGSPAALVGAARGLDNVGYYAREMGEVGILQRVRRILAQLGCVGTQHQQRDRELVELHSASLSAREPARGPIDIRRGTGLASSYMRSDARPAWTDTVGPLPSRTVVVLDAIKHAILTGELRPGQCLVETDLAGLLGVSKTPVREALKTLAGAGLVTMSPYKGAAVRVVDDDLVRSVYDLRLLLEPEAVRRAAGRGADCGTARRALRQAAVAPDWAARSLANRDFHRGLYLGCGNGLLISVLDGLRDQTALVSAAAWRQSLAWEPSGARVPAWEQEAAEHEAILAAAAGGDADGAARLLAGHIESFLTRNFPTATETGDTDAP
jgi:DNA-binding GntR family transcriptional regulator